MAWAKSSERLIAAFDASLPKDPAAERRKMFSYPCCFVNGQMFTGLHQENMVVRLPEDERAVLMGAGGTVFEPMKGRVMKEYVSLPAAMTHDAVALKKWVKRAFTFAQSLPPKQPKAPKKSAKAAPKPQAKTPAKKAVKTATVSAKKRAR